MKALNSLKKESGFTLVEVMVVIVILGILAVVAVPIYSNYVRRAKVNEAITNVGILSTAIKIYRMERGTWPTKAQITGDDALVGYKLDINEHYFTIMEWGEISKGADLVIIVNANAYDEEGASFSYTIDQNYKGEWKDISGDVLANYAHYLKPVGTN